jgi:hypothetical protein
VQTRGGRLSRSTNWWSVSIGRYQDRLLILVYDQLPLWPPSFLPFHRAMLRMQLKFVPSPRRRDLPPDLDLGAAQLIQQANSPQSQISPEQQRALQQQLLEVQKRPEAWGLVVPFLENPNPNIQFFGAHTVQLKIARDWCVCSPGRGKALAAS